MGSPEPRLVRVVAVSPADVQAERKLIAAVVEELNRFLAPQHGCHLLLWRWETDAHPGLHLEGPQGLIDDGMQIEDADVVVGVFWKRFGTPTHKSGSGTEHELRRAWRAWERRGRPEVMLYFCERKSRMPKTANEAAQLQHLIAFRDEMPTQQVWWSYSKLVDFERAVRKHLTAFVQAIAEPPTASAAEAPPPTVPALHTANVHPNTKPTAGRRGKPSAEPSATAFQRPLGSAAKPEALVGASALIVEDNKEWLGILRDELLGAGFRIDFAFERDEALRKISEPPFRYDVIVLDPNLGDSLGGLSGLSIAEHVATAPHGASVIVVSGFADRDALRADYAHLTPPVVECFEKRGLDIDKFRSTLRRLRGVEDPDDAMFTPDREVLAKAWDATLRATTAHDKGVALEWLGIALLSGIPLLTLHESRATSPTAEIDAVFSVYAAAGTLCQEWGRLLLVECRHRVSKVDAPGIRAFASKMAEVDAKAGIVISYTGVTGQQRQAARGVINNIYGSDRRVIIVLDGRDIMDVVENGANLYTLLQRRDMDVRLRRA